MSSSSLTSVVFQQHGKSKRSFSRRALAVAGMMAFGSLAAQAATLQWNPSSGDGSGVWDSATANWHDGTGSAIWQAGDIAEFSGSAGVVSLGSAVDVGGLGFLSDGYTLNGQGHIISLAGTTSTAVNVAAGRVVIDAMLSGTGALLKTGGGTLVLKGEQSYAGTIVSGGTLELADIGILKPHVEVLTTTEFPYRRSQASYLIKLNGTVENSPTLVISQDTTLVGKDYDGNQSNDNRIVVEGAGIITVNQGATLAIRGFQKGDSFSTPVNVSGTLKISGDGDVVFEDNGRSIVTALGSSVEINTTGKVSFIRCQEGSVNSGPIGGTIKVTRGTLYFEKTGMMNVNGSLELKSADVLTPCVLSGEGAFLMIGGSFEDAILEPIRTGDHMGSGYLMIRNFPSTGSGGSVTSTNLTNMTIKGKDGCISTTFSIFPEEGGALIFNIKGSLTADIGDVGYLSLTKNTVTIMAPLSGDGDLLKKGFGTLLLNGVNTYTGGTILNEGTLIGNIPTDSAFTIAAGAAYLSGDSTREYADPQDRQFASLDGAGLVDMKGKNLGIGEGNFAAGVMQNIATLKKISDGTSEGGWFSIGTTAATSASVEAGTLEVASEKQLSVSNSLTISDGATLAVTANSAKPSVVAREVVIGTNGTTLDISGYTSNTPVTLIRTQNGIQGDFSRITIGGQSLASTITLDTFASAMVQRSSDNKSLQASVGLVWNNTLPDSAHGTFNIDSGSFTVNSVLANNDAAINGDAGRAFGWDGKSLSKTGTGILVLSERNTYTGTTFVDQGMLRLGDGANRDFNGNMDTLSVGDIAYTGAEAFQKNALGGQTRLGENKSGPVTGPIVNNGSLVINWANYWAYEGALTGTGDLIQVGAGNVVLRGGSNYAGATYIQNGTLFNTNMNFQKSVTVTGGQFLNGSEGSVQGGIRQTNGSILNNGTVTGGVVIEKGFFIQSGSVNGQVTVDAYGTLLWSNGTIAGNINNQGQIFFGRGNGPASTYESSIPSNGVFNISRDIVAYNSTQSRIAPVVLQGDIVNGASGKFVILGGTIEGNINNSGKLIFANYSDYAHDRSIENNGELILDSAKKLTISSAITGTGSLDKLGAGSVILSAANTYTGATGIKKGTLVAEANDVFARSARVTVGNGTVSHPSQSPMFDLNKHDQSIQSLDMQQGIVRLGPEYPRPSTGGGSSGSGSSGVVISIGSASGSLTLSGVNYSGINLGETFFENGKLAIITWPGFSVNGASTEIYYLNQPVRFQALADAADPVPEQFTTLKIGQISGVGTFQLRANLLSGGHDQLIVTDSASGVHLVNVSFLFDAESMANQTVELIRIDDPASTAVFTLANGPLSGGLRAYTLERGSTLGSGHSDNSYYFTNLNDAMSAMGSVVVATSVDSALLWLTQLDNLHKRMGDLRLGGVRDMASWDTWVRGYAQQVNMKADVAGLPYKSHMYGADVGADKAWQMGDNGTLFTGLYAGYGRAKRDFDQGSSGSTDNLYGGVYGTWVHLSGWYVDMVAKVQNFDNSFDAIDGWGFKSSGSYTNWGYGASVETGYPFAFGDKWFIEPIAQVAYTRITDADYSTDTGVRVGVGSTDVLQARGMVRFGKVCQVGESIVQPYVKVGIVGQTSSGGEVRGSGGSWSVDTDGVRGEAGCGVSWLIDNANQIYLDYEASFGDAYTKPWALNFGFRHQF